VSTDPSTPVMFDARGVRDLAPLALDEAGRLRLLPASFWASTTVAERAVFGNRHALYSFPTTELVAWLQDFIGPRSAMEIGAGNGVLAEALGIPAVDNRMQEWPHIAAVYAASGQPTIGYGPAVQQMDALVAVKKTRPSVVIACWVTHKYDPKRHQAGGNMYGVVEEQLLPHCQHYVLVGNEQVHRDKSLWDRPHEIHYPDWLYSRAHNGSRNFIAVWRGAK
jgi:hypothetical protein